MLTRTPKLLIVEDNPDHTEMIQIALSSDNLLNKIYTVTNGEEALDYLYRRGEYIDKSKSPRPSLVLLDIKLPRIDGFEVLRHIKSDENLKSIPVILLTTSTEKSEIKRGYEYGANSYVTKPLRFGEFMDRVKNIYTYWILTNLLPTMEHNGYSD